ncbi:unnamed protein product [Caenorhabditis bovis]|uniref:Spaetzle domain-containing protein n=1 Tax=Caenorhabditis bovis TaxID=2654633 RepID=A0A8S1EBC0_9PELO|nr:unnamed protein product [Caenorhabditis bovis]
MIAIQILLCAINWFTTSYGYALFVEPHLHTKHGHVLSFEPVKLIEGQQKVEKNLNPLFESVCDVEIKPSIRPSFGILSNGTKVHIRQDELSFFEATFVECRNTRKTCYGVEHGLFHSECVTVYEHRVTSVRLLHPGSHYFDAVIKVPVACQCQLQGKDEDLL